MTLIHIMRLYEFFRHNSYINGATRLIVRFRKHRDSSSVQHSGVANGLYAERSQPVVWTADLPATLPVMPLTAFLWRLLSQKPDL